VVVSPVFSERAASLRGDRSPVDRERHAQDFDRLRSRSGSADIHDRHREALRLSSCARAGSSSRRPRIRSMREMNHRRFFIPIPPQSVNYRPPPCLGVECQQEYARPREHCQARMLFIPRGDPFGDLVDTRTRSLRTLRIAWDALTPSCRRSMAETEESVASSPQDAGYPNALRRAVLVTVFAPRAGSRWLLGKRHRVERPRSSGGPSPSGSPIRGYPGRR
jgi:hypothetical protein